jgi:hypothetical protein
MGLGAIRYRGLAKAQGQVLLSALAFNLRRWTRLVTARARPDSASAWRKPPAGPHRRS